MSVGFEANGTSYAQYAQLNHDAGRRKGGEGREGKGRKEKKTTSEKPQELN